MLLRHGYFQIFDKTIAARHASPLSVSTPSFSGGGSRGDDLVAGVYLPHDGAGRDDVDDRRLTQSSVCSGSFSVAMGMIVWCAYREALFETVGWVRVSVCAAGVAVYLCVWLVCARQVLGWYGEGILRHETTYYPLCTVHDL